MNRLRNDPRFSQQKLQDFTVAAKAKLSPQQFQKLTEEDLARFIVAREGNVTTALRQLQGSVEWFEKELGDHIITCPLCTKDPTCHSHIPIGIEQSEKSTILYGCPARATHSAVDPIVQHVTLQLEYCFTPTSSRWIWCVDYNGFGFKEALQGKLAAKFGVLFNNHMPERLHKIILLNPPSVFKLLLKAVKPFVDEKTLDKLIPVTGSTKVVLQTLREQHHFPEYALEWLEETLNQKLPNQLPPLPSVSKELLLPSLVPVFEFVEDPVEIKPTNSGPMVKATSIVKAQTDEHNQIWVNGIKRPRTDPI